MLGCYLWRRRHVELVKTGFSVAMWMALILTPRQIVLGDMHGRSTRQYQPIKVAAMEGDWQRAPGSRSSSSHGPILAARCNEYALRSRSLILILTDDWNGRVEDLKAVPPDQPPPMRRLWDLGI